MGGEILGVLVVWIGLGAGVGEVDFIQARLVLLLRINGARDFSFRLMEIFHCFWMDVRIE